MENDNLALELLMQLKSTIKRLFVVIVILLITLLVTNLAWLYFWNLPTDTTTTTISQDCSDEGNNNYIGDDGDINGETSNN